MLTIKKDYEPVMALFKTAIEIASQNKVKKSTIELMQAEYNKALELTASKNSNGSGSKSTAYWQDGKLVAVFCYYHKKWELVDHIEYGKKAGTKTGLNTMCKEGTSAWTRQNRQKQKHQDDMMKKLLAKEITAEEVTPYNATIEPHGDEDHSFDTLEQLQAFLANPAEAE